MASFEKVVRRLDEAWRWLDTQQRALLMCALLLSAAAVAIALATGPSQIIGPWDVFTLLGGAWRMFNGQIPHTDFYSPLGMLWIWPASVAMHIVGPSLAAVHYAHVTLAALVTGAGAFLFFRKLSPTLAGMLTIFVVLLMLATRALGHPAADSTYAMSYNRLGWALSILLCITLFVADRPGRRAQRDMAVAGVLLGLLFYCKITFFAVAVGAWVLAIIIEPDLRRAWVASALGFVVILSAAFLASGVNPAAYFGDLAMAARSQSGALRGHMVAETLRANAVQLILGIALWAALVAQPYLAKRLDWQAALKVTLLVGFAASAGLAISPGNSSEGNDVPFFLLAGVLLLELSHRSLPAPQPAPWTAARLFALLTVGAIYFVGIARNDAASLAVSFAHRHEGQAPSEQGQRFDSAALRDFWIPSTSDHQTAYNLSRDVPARINDALRLVRANTNAPARLVVLANSDPLSFALGWRPAHGGALWFSRDYSFNERSHLSPEAMFADADLVIYPIIRPEDGGVDADSAALLLQIYGPYLSQHFSEAGRSAGWVLLRRRGA